MLVVETVVVVKIRKGMKGVAVDLDTCLSISFLGGDTDCGIVADTWGVVLVSVVVTVVVVQLREVTPAVVVEGNCTDGVVVKSDTCLSGFFLGGDADDDW